MSAVLNNISQTEEQIGNIGITKVHLSPDCTHARISVHIDGDHNSVQRSLAWLGRHSKTLRFQMGTKLNHRKRVPVIQFVHDKTTGFNLFDIRDMIKEATQNELNNANPKSDSVQENPIDFDEATNIATDTNGDNSNYPHDENENGETGKMDIDYPDLEDEDDKMDNMVNDEQLEEFLSDFDEKHVKAVLDSLKDI
ncbi:conserved Plasmodium protein, unknown function [Babesia microti strain RI]|uniref:Ribosome-binding factor A n=1 Tax=Babesia microti (strain RI) TaxID=1133968 RepID=A0A1N6LWD6_BABMR|nr:conserved Plasmodium protein, unknown function [Babesia microti strain RI]SIO73179.1 conserved Plasmodium protein, unknown function [Babesia microti strain RI]|eukprot:XP_021337288.1 conserved Plasmodium protein, unknown function [Babesia microti strain RI]